MRKLVAIPNSAEEARCIKITTAMRLRAGPIPTLAASRRPRSTRCGFILPISAPPRGLVTDEVARVLDAGNQPIAGLYACGNDMQSIMGGTYPGPGITLGPAIAFAYIAASDAARRMGVE